MNQHAQISDLLPLYVSGALDRDQRLAVEKHLAGCAECRADLAIWQLAGDEIVAAGMALDAPPGLAERALEQAGRQASRPRFAWARRLGQLLRSQMPLVHREIWPASAAVIGLGYITALVANQAGVIYGMAPLVAAGCISLIYGPENDPAYELALATPTSQRQILLARLALVFGYNLALVLAATLGLLPVIDELLFGPLLLNWLAPMAFLSAAALALSLWIGAPNAIAITYLAWLGRLLAGPLSSPKAAIEFSPDVARVMAAYQNFWAAPALLLALSALLLVGAIWLAGRQTAGRLDPA